MNNMHFSAGAVVIGPDNKIVVVNQNNDSWSLPKGHLDPGEDEEQAAVREVYEESGLQDITIIEKLGEYERPRTGKGGVGLDETQFKHITLFLAITNQKDLQPIDPDNPEARWLPISEVADLLTNQKDKEFFISITPKILKYLAG